MNELKVQERTAFGKKARIVRREGSIPAEIYGRGVANRHVAVPVKEFVALYRTAGSHTVITLATGDAKIPVVVADVVKDHLTDEILAVDFHAIRTDEKIRAKVPVVFTGTAPAAKAGFIVVEVLHELEIEAFPQELLHKIEVSVDTLEKPGDSVALKDIAIPSSIKLHVPAETVLVTVREHVKEVAPPPPAAESTAPAEGAAPAAPEAAAEPEKK